MKAKVEELIEWLRSFDKGSHVQIFQDMLVGVEERDLSEAFFEVGIFPGNDILAEFLKDFPQYRKPKEDWIQLGRNTDVACHICGRRDTIHHRRVVKGRTTRFACTHCKNAGGRDVFEVPGLDQYILYRLQR